MTQLTDEAKAAIRDEFRDFIYLYQKTLDEMNLYKWIIRALFILLLGGSIYGVVKFQDYLDDRVAKRASQFDNLYLANILASSNQFRNALEELGSFLEKNTNDSKDANQIASGIDFEFSHLSRLSKSQRDFFFLTMLEALHYIDDVGPDGEFIGKKYWRALLSSRLFNRDFVENQRWASDAKFANRMANAYVRFADTNADILIAKKYFQTGLSNSPNNSWRAANHVGLAFTSLLLGDANDATKNIYGANRQRPNYITLDGFLNETTDFPTYERAWLKLNHTDFRSECARLFQQALVYEADEKVSAQIAGLQDKDKTFDRTKFIAAVKEIYERIMTAYLKGSKNDLLQNTSPEIYGAFSDNIRYREELQQRVNFVSMAAKEINIVDIDVALSDVSITVRFLSDQIISWHAKDGALLEGNADHSEVRVDTWVFRRKSNAPNTQWFVVGAKNG